MGGEALVVWQRGGQSTSLTPLSGGGGREKEKKKKEATLMVKSGKESEGWCNRVDVGSQGVRAIACLWSGSMLHLVVFIAPIPADGLTHAGTGKCEPEISWRDGHHTLPGAIIRLEVSRSRHYWVRPNSSDVRQGYELQT